MQDKQALEAQKVEQWVPKVGSMIFVPRMKGNFKASIHPSSMSVTLISMILSDHDSFQSRGA